MLTIPIAKVREDLSETANRVAYAGERVIVERRGRPLFAIIPVDDLELLERLEDEADAKAAKKVLADMARKGEKPIPWETIKKRHGL